MNSPAPDAASRAISRNARVGLVLFFIYLAIYLGFILLNACARDVMARPSLGGMNFAVVYGFALIIGAFVLALVYMVLCTPEIAPGPDVTEGTLAEKFESEEGAA